MTNKPEKLRLMTGVSPEVRGEVCRRVIAELPEWFGIAAANADYVRAAGDLPGLVIGDDDGPVGLLVYRRYYNETLAATCFDMHWLGLLPGCHRQGGGSALLAELERLAQADGDIGFLTAETLDPEAGDVAYLKTFAFYQHRGFRIYAHFRYDENNPMVRLARKTGGSPAL